MMKVEQCSRKGEAVFVVVCYACGWLSSAHSDPMEAHVLMPGHDCPGKPTWETGSHLQAARPIVLV